MRDVKFYVIVFASILFTICLIVSLAYNISLASQASQRTISRSLDSKKQVKLSALSFGNDPQQKLDLTYIEGVKSPLVVIIPDYFNVDNKTNNVQVLAEYFQERGYNTIIPEYRLVDGDKNKFPKPVEDVACATAWAISNYSNMDNNKVIMVGLETGGHIASLLSYNRAGKYLENCIVKDKNFVIRGLISIDGFYHFTVEEALSNEFVKKYLSLNNDQKNLDGLLPYDYAGRVSPNTLLIANPRNRFYSNTNIQKLKTKLKDAGIKNQYIEFNPDSENKYINELIIQINFQSTVGDFF
jgi:hypothetical protein